MTTSEPIIEEENELEPVKVRIEIPGQPIPITMNLRMERSLVATWGARYARKLGEMITDTLVMSAEIDTGVWDKRYEREQKAREEGAK